MSSGMKLAVGYAPQGLVEGCDGNWLFYGPDQSAADIPEEAWTTVQAPEPAAIGR